MRIVLILTWLGLAATGVQAQPAPVPVTTDTPEYCDRMIQQVEAGPDLTDEMLRLLDEGQRLCGRGHVRGGVMRLRRALLLIRARGASAAPAE